MRTRRRIAFMLGAAGLAVAAGLILAEVIVRVRFPHARDLAVPGHMFVIDDDLGWKLSPSKTATHQSRYFDVPYTTNPQGFRDKVREPTRTARRRRLLLYGDSLIFGWGVPQSERFSDRIEHDVPDVELWNHAVPGYGLDQELVLYQKEAASSNADGVAFFVSATTLSRVHRQFAFSKYKPVFVNNPDGRLRLIPVPSARNALVSFIYDTLSPFYLPYFLQAEGERLLLASPEPKRPGERPSTRIGRFELSLLQLAHRTALDARQDMTVLVAGLSTADRQALQTFCRDNSIRYLEIGPELIGPPQPEAQRALIFGPSDRHWNARANTLIADAIGVALAERTTPSRRAN